MRPVFAPSVFVLAGCTLVVGGDPRLVDAGGDAGSPAAAKDATPAPSVDQTCNVAACNAAKETCKKACGAAAKQCNDGCDDDKSCHTACNHELQACNASCVAACVQCVSGCGTCSP
jgi:hypothetical protein